MSGEKKETVLTLSPQAKKRSERVLHIADIYSHECYLIESEKHHRIENYFIGCNDLSDYVMNAMLFIDSLGEETLMSCDDDFVKNFVRKSYG